MGSLKDKLLRAGVVTPTDANRVEAQAKGDAAAEKRSREQRAVTASRARREQQTAPFRIARESGATSAVEAWDDFERKVNTLGFAWALRTIPGDVEWEDAAARNEPGWEQGFPDSYRRLIAHAGHRSFGLCYYCRDGFSFLPPGPMAACSMNVSDEELETAVPKSKVAQAEGPCRYRFFAGIELSDLDGWAFSADPRDPPGLVWNVESAMVRAPALMFDEWLASRLSALVTRMEAMAPDESARLEAEHDPDPHRVIDYSVKR